MMRRTSARLQMKFRADIANRGPATSADGKSKNPYQATGTKVKSNVRLTMKKKSLAQSYTEHLIDYLRPRNTHGDLVDPTQLAKFVSYLALPVLTILCWRWALADAPAKLEKKTKNLVHSLPKETSRKMKGTQANIVQNVEERQAEAYQSHIEKLQELRERVDSKPVQ